MSVSDHRSLRYKLLPVIYSHSLIYCDNISDYCRFQRISDVDKLLPGLWWDIMSECCDFQFISISTSRSVVLKLGYIAPPVGDRAAKGGEKNGRGR